MRIFPDLSLWCAIIASASGAVPAPGQEQEQSAPRTTVVTAEPITPAGALDPVADKILTRLESRKVYDLRTGVTWRTRSPLQQFKDAIEKRGELYFKEFDPVPKFLVKFDKRISNGKVRPIDEEIMFDGRWYIELDGPPQKTVFRREIRRAGDEMNPYKIGEGSFPLPFGQKKADILKEFTVETKPTSEGDPPGTDRLRLTPRPDTKSERLYEWVDLWIEKDEGDLPGLPVRVETGKKNNTGRLDTVITISFSDVKINPGLSANVFEIRTPAGFNEEIEPLPPQ